MAVRDFLLPDLGEGLEDAEVVSWKVAEGDQVELNQTLVEVNTAKALVDVVKVGQPLVSIEVSAASAGGDEKPKRKAVLVGYGVDEEQEFRRARKDRRAEPARAEATVRATPPVRKLAKELGVDMAAVSGSGPHGRVTRDDVEGAATTGSEAEDASTPDRGRPVTWESIPLRGNRRIIAEHMTRSAREIPHVTTWVTVDASWLMALRDELSAESGERISPLSIVVRALAEVSGEHPKLNASLQEEQKEIAVFSWCNVGIAVDTDDGLLVPVIHDVQTRGIRDVARAIGKLSATARARRLKPEQMRGGTITVTNVGSFGSESGTPIINHPEAAILLLGMIEERALVVDGEVVPRPACTLALSFDHRVMDGAEAGRALKALKDLLESPFRLGALPR
jgi:2-oxoisovalerate dehydrogenase E2 component (dihydrolipoyl transacylase)